MKRIDVDQSFPAFMRRGVMRVACAAAVASVIGLAIFPSSAAETDWSKVAAALGKSGAVMPGEVYRVGMPRTDLHVTLDGVELKPTLALGSWVAFDGTGTDTMVMGDLVLTESEISPVMKQLLAERHRDHGSAQSSAARAAGNLLHACARARRSGETGDGIA